MSATEIIAFLFKLINFGALAGLFIYLFQRKVKDRIKTKIKEKEVFWQNLQTNKQALIDQQHKLRIEIACQKDYGNALLQKIVLWHKASSLQEQAFIEEAKINAQKVYERTRTFHEKKEERELLQQIVPLAIDEARKTLEDRFAQEKNAEKYMANIFRYLKKSSS